MLGHLLVVVAGVYGGHDVEGACDYHGDVDGGVAQEVGVGEHVAPVDGVGDHDPAAGEGGQMVAPASRAGGIRTAHLASIHGPVVVRFSQGEALRHILAQLECSLEVIGSVSISRDRGAPAGHIHVVFGCVQFANTDVDLAQETARIRIAQEEPVSV
ncbi:hypothetical protein EGW08_019063, partial [Elysia chlorotica]